MTTKQMGTSDPQQPAAIVPKPQYLKLSPATMEYHQIMTLSQELGCSWQDIAREALRKYLREFYPKRKV